MRERGSPAPGDRRRLDRLGAGDGRAARGDRAPAERRRRAARPGPGASMRRAGRRSAPSEREPAGAGHPQYGLKKLLEQLGAERAMRSCRCGKRRRAARASAVISSPNRCARRARPSAGASAAVSGPRQTSGRARRHRASSRPRTSARRRSRSQCSCAQAAEAAGRVAALVTPDRGLARRVAVELQRWGIEVDDSAGRPLGAHAARRAGAARRRGGARRRRRGDAARAAEASARRLSACRRRTRAAPRARWSARCCAGRG